VSPDEDLSEYAETFKRHEELGIEAYVVQLSEVRPELHSDFVVYDEAWVRRALSDDVISSDSLSGKIIEFSESAADVDQALDDFSEILALTVGNPRYTLEAHLNSIEDEA
jgi:hypothetical protein